MKVVFPSCGEYGVYDKMGLRVAVFKPLDDAFQFVKDCWVEGEGFEATIVDELTGEIICEFSDGFHEPLSLVQLYNGRKSAQEN